MKFANGQTSLILDAKETEKVSNDLLYANDVFQAKFHQLEQDIEWLKKVYHQDASLQPILESIDGSVKELEPVAREIDKSSEQLKKAVEKVSEQDRENVED